MNLPEPVQVNANSSRSIVHNELVRTVESDINKTNFKKKQNKKESKRRQQRKSVSFSSLEYLSSSPNLHSSPNIFSDLPPTPQPLHKASCFRAPDSPTTQLLCSVLERNPQSARVLLKPLEINRQSAQFNEDTCLHLACREGDSKMVEELLKTEGINVNMQNRDGDTPLHIAARQGLGEIVYILILFQGIMPNISNLSGNTPLHEAAKNATEESFQAFHILLMSLNVDLKSRNHDSHSYKFYIK